MNWRDFAPEYVIGLQVKAGEVSTQARFEYMYAKDLGVGLGFVAKLQRESARVSAAARLALGVDRRPSARRGR